MNLVIIDMEFENQTQRDIIQVGAVKVDLQTGQIHPFFDEFIRLPPGVCLTHYIRKLTGINPADLEHAQEAKQVFTAFWSKFKKASVGYRLAGWGDDAPWIIQQSRRHNVPNIPKVVQYDIKQLFQFLRLQNGFSATNKTGLRNTMDLFEVPFVGRHHNAYDDAFNTARLLIKGLNSRDLLDP